MDSAVEAKIRKATKIATAIIRFGNKDIAVLTILTPLFHAFEKSIGIGAVITLHKFGVRI